MSIQFKCSSCAKTLTVPDATAGQLARCPSCSNIIRVPAAESKVPEIKRDEATPPPEPEEVTPPAMPADVPAEGVTTPDNVRREPPPIDDEPEMPRRRQRDEDDDDERVAPRRREDDDERAPARRRPRDDDDDDRGPRRRRRETIRCPECGERNDEDEARCVRCGYSLRGRGNDAMATLIPYRNAAALWSYYLGVFSLVPCLGIPLFIAAPILGIMGLSHASRYPDAKGQAHAWVGIVLGAISFTYHVVFFVFMILMGQRK